MLRDNAPEIGASERIASLTGRLTALRALIGGHRPDLRRSEELFHEFEAYDLRGLKHATLAQLETKLRGAQRKLYEGTKFAKLARWRAASLLYLVVEQGIMEPHEVPVGWGLLERRGPELVPVSQPCLNATTPEERVGLVERIAAASASRWQRRLGDLDEASPGSPTPATPPGIAAGVLRIPGSSPGARID